MELYTWIKNTYLSIVINYQSFYGINKLIFSRDSTFWFFTSLFFYWNYKSICQKSSMFFAPVIFERILKNKWYFVNFQIIVVFPCKVKNLNIIWFPAHCIFYFWSTMWNGYTINLNIYNESQIIPIITYNIFNISNLMFFLFY